MPTNIQSIQPSLTQIYKPQKKHSAAGEYYDFNNDGRVGAGELVSENQTTESILEHVLYAENNILKIQQVYDIVSLANDRTQKSINTFESQLIARACLLAGGVPAREIPRYFLKLEYLFSDFEKYNTKNNLHADNPYQIIDNLSNFLWQLKTERFDIDAYALQTTIDERVGNCVPLTALFNVMAVRAGLAAKTVFEEGHVYSAYHNRSIQTTTPPKINYLRENIRVSSAFSIVSEICTYHAKELSASGYEDAAIKFSQTALALNPDDPTYSFNLGTTYLENGQNEAALQFFEQSLRLGYAHEYLYWNMGLAHLKMGHLSDAYDNFLTSINTKPPENPKNKVEESKPATATRLSIEPRSWTNWGGHYFQKIKDLFN
jgi:tetratricopeptide (TPR) repeat protein